MTLAWTAHPARRRPQDAMLAASVILVSAYAILVSLRSPLLAALAVVMLLVAIAPFLVPTRYQLDAEQLVWRRLFVTRTRRWSELRRLEVGKTAALVSPYRKPRWLDRYRGITMILPVPGDGADRDTVVRELQGRVGT
ncbi:MAG: hypothetical protein WKG01_15055 [Kofleriaceae bacterium]